MRNTKFIIFTILFAILMISGYTVFKIQKRHLELSILVTERRILEGAEQCFYEDKCSGSTFSLEMLINLGYVKDEVNPVTKLYYNKKSYVEKKENTYTFIEVS